MAVNATFYNFSKRKNSTAIPTGAGTVLSVELKSGVDMLNPSFLIAAENQPRYTYLLFEGRFYYITGVTSVRTGLWEIAAAVDVLSTYKPNIKASSAFIKYMTGGNNKLIDDRLPVNSEPIISSNSVAVPVVGDSIIGTYLVTLTGEEKCGTYALTGGLKNLMLKWESFGTIWDEKVSSGDIIDAVLSVGKQLVSTGNMAQNIRSCIWTPLDIAEGNLTEIYVGMYDTGMTGFEVTTKIKTFDYTINIPWNFSDWRRSAPYTNVYLYMPFIGLVSYSSANLVGISALNVRLSVNMFTGDVAYQVKAGAEVLGTYSATTGVSFPIGQSNINPMGLASGVIGTAGGLATGNVAGAIMASLMALSPNSSTAGSLNGGASAGLEKNLVCYTVSHNTSINPANMAAVKGIPYFGVTALTEVTGYVESENFSVVDTYSNMTSTEKDMINDLMDGGVYIE